MSACCVVCWGHLAKAGGFYTGRALSVACGRHANWRCYAQPFDGGVDDAIPGRRREW